MTDLATLIIEVDSSAVPKGTAALDKLTSAGKRTESEMKRVTGSTRTASQAAADLAAKTQVSARAATGLGSGFNRLGAAAAGARANVGLLGSELGNLAGGLTTGSMGAQSAASSIGRLTVASGVGVGALGSLAAIGGILGAAFLGVKQSAEAADPSARRLISTMGLTREEIEKLTDTSVTWGDVMGATFDVLAERAGTSSKEFQSTWGYALAKVGEFGKFSASVVLGAFAAAVKGVVSLWGNIPGIIGNAAVSAANATIRAFQDLLNVGAAALNRFGGMINSALGKDVVGQIGNITLPTIQAKFHGSFSAIGSDIKNQLYGTFSDVMAGFDRIEARAGQRRAGRVMSQIDDAIADRTSKAAAAHLKRAKAASDEADALTKLLGARRSLMMGPQDISPDLLADEPDRLDLSGISNLLKDVKVVMTPFDEWAKTIPQTADQITTALQGIAVQGFDSLSMAITDVITGTSSLKDAFSNIARSIIQQIIQMTVRMLIFRAVSSAFGSSFGNPASIGGGAGGVGFFGLIGSANGNSFMLGGNPGVDNNVLSLNGKPFSRVSAGEMAVIQPKRAQQGSSSEAGPVNITVNVNAKDAVLTHAVKGWITEGIYQAAPAIISGARQSTVRTLQRRRIS